MVLGQLLRHRAEGVPRSRAQRVRRGAGGQEGGGGGPRTDKVQNKNIYVRGTSSHMMKTNFSLQGQLQQFELRLLRPLAPPLLRGVVQKGENLPFERRQLRTDRRQGKGIGGSDERGRR